MPHFLGQTHTCNSGEELCIDHLLGAQAKQTPDAVAIASPQRRPLTYGQLVEQVGYTIGSLRAMGIGRNDRIAIVLPNGPEMAVAFLGVSSGAISAPLNPACREAEFDFYLSDLNAKAVIVQSSVDSPAISVAQRLGVPIIRLTAALQDPAGIFTLQDDSGACPIKNGSAYPDDVALVLYSSGTTAKPKRVSLTHRNLCVSADNVRTALQLTREDRCLNVMPLYHIHGLVGGLFSSLAAGASVVCTPGFYTPNFFSWLDEFHPTWYTAVPTIHQAVLAEVQSNLEIIRRCPLRFIRSSSAPLPPRVMADLEGKFQAPVIESYGMTEAAHQMTSNPLPPGRRKAGSVGLPAGPEVAIMNGAGNHLLPWQIGEVVIRGANVMRGYDDNPTESLAAFTAGWLRTGDQGYLDSDGYLFLTGRLKEVVNRGGEKIALREIDEALLDHPQVFQAAAFAVPHPTFGEQIAAAVVVLDKDQITESMIREYLFGRLAEFKVPSRVLIVDELPNGSTGKIQRMKLAAVFAQRLAKEFVKPRNELEIVVASIFADVLGVEKISADDDFLRLGGDSLRATQVISRIRALFQVDLPIVTLFNKATVAKLAAEIAASIEFLAATSTEKILTGLHDLSEAGGPRSLAGTWDRNSSSK